MTITREQLELAAKAAGMSLSHWEYNEGRFRHRKHKDIHWEPDEDHGQLLDLAMACGMFVDFEFGRVGSNYYGIAGDFTPGDFTALAEAVITAAAEQQLAKEKKE